MVLATAESVFLESDGILVTNTRAVMGGVTYPMSNITSVRSKELDSPYAIPLLVTAFAGFLVASYAYAQASWLASIAGGLVMVASLVSAFRLNPMHVVVLCSGGGELHAFVSKDRMEVRQIIDAMTQAVIARG